MRRWVLLGCLASCALAGAQEKLRYNLVADSGDFSSYSSRTVGLSSVVPLFDPSLGNLTQVFIAPSPSFKTTFSGFNSTSSAKSFSVKIPWVSTITFAGSDVFNIQDGGETWTGTVNTSVGPRLFTAGFGSSKTITGSANLARYTGSGQLPIVFVVDPDLITSGFTSTTSTHRVTLGGYVEYTYEAVPEPVTFATLGLGVIGVMRKRRRSRAESR